MEITAKRQTKYCSEIERQLRIVGHATNAELLISLRKSYPKLSATTVHRATSRLAQRGVISVAPPSCDGSMRYDANIKPHDHFQCSSCGILRDTDVRDKIIPILKDSIEDCDISGQLTINGVCIQCKNQGEKNENNNL